MRNELLKELQIDDLQGENRELAECIGMEAFIKLVDVYGGTGRLYIPQPDTLLIPVRDKKICEQFNGGNIYELAHKWGLSDGYIRKIVKDRLAEIRRTPPTGQLSLDEFV
ncbi:Mor transcription activator family protein [uncultured Clostridium sp.]